MWFQLNHRCTSSGGCGGCITTRIYSVKNGARKRPTQSKWEIYLFIVTVRIKSTYPVMFVMIFDSILLVGILKRRTALKHSCLMNKRSMLVAVAKWWNLVHSVNWVFFMFALFFPFRSIQSSEIAMNLWALLSVPFSRYWFLNNFFFSLRFFWWASLSTIRNSFRVYWISLWSRAACMCNVILLFCSRLFRITFVGASGRTSQCVYVSVFKFMYAANIYVCMYEKYILML